VKSELLLGRILGILRENQLSNNFESFQKDCRYNGTKYSHIVWCGENQGNFRLANRPRDQATISKEYFENIEKNSLRISPVIVIGRLVISKKSLIAAQMN